MSEMYENRQNTLGVEKRYLDVKTKNSHKSLLKHD